MHFPQQEHEELRSIMLVAPSVHRVVPFHTRLHGERHIGDITQGPQRLQQPGHLVQERKISAQLATIVCVDHHSSDHYKCRLATVNEIAILS